MAEDIKNFIDNLGKPFEGMKMNRTATVKKFLNILAIISEIQKGEADTVKKAVKVTKQATKIVNDSLKAITQDTASLGKNLPAIWKASPLAKLADAMRESLGEGPVAAPQKFGGLLEAPKGAPKSPGEVEQDEEEKEMMEENEKQSGLLKSIWEAFKDNRAQEALQQEIEGLEDTARDAYFGPLAGIAKSTEETAKSILKSAFSGAVQWYKERKEAKKAAKEQKKIREELEGLHKTTKIQFLMGIWDKLMNVSSIIGNFLSSETFLKAALAGAIALAMKDVFKDMWKNLAPHFDGYT